MVFLDEDVVAIVIVIDIVATEAAVVIVNVVLAMVTQLMQLLLLGAVAATETKAETDIATETGPDGPGVAIVRMLEPGSQASLLVTQSQSVVAPL